MVFVHGEVLLAHDNTLGRKAQPDATRESGFEQQLNTQYFSNTASSDYFLLGNLEKRTNEENNRFERNTIFVRRKVEGRFRLLKVKNKETVSLSKHRYEKFVAVSGDCRRTK